MSSLDNNIQAFFALVRAGLWEQEVQLSQIGEIDFMDVYRLAVEQSVVGLVAAGIEHVSDVKIPQEAAFAFVGDTLQLEQRNMAMNDYIAKLIEELRKKDVYTILVKGQGIAQCYERPLWRACGDIDLLLSVVDYEKAKTVLLPIAVDVEKEYNSLKHVALTMNGGYVVELHGTLHSRLSQKMNDGIDEAQDDVFYSSNVRSWQNEKTQIFLPGVDSDVIFLFTHILHHFYIEGIGLRQICDWCRFLWLYKDELNYLLLEKRLKNMGLLSEWKVFASFAVNYLGMPVETMPLFNENDNKNKKMHRKAKRILEFVLETGNFGQNREPAGNKARSVWRKTKDFSRHARIFPCDSVKFFFHFVESGIMIAKNN